MYLCRQHRAVHRHSSLLSGAPIPTWMLESKTTEFKNEAFLQYIIMKFKALRMIRTTVGKKSQNTDDFELVSSSTSVLTAATGYAWVGMT